MKLKTKSVLFQELAYVVVVAALVTLVVFYKELMTGLLILVGCVTVSNTVIPWIVEWVFARLGFKDDDTADSKDT